MRTETTRGGRRSGMSFVQIGTQRVEGMTCCTVLCDAYRRMGIMDCRCSVFIKWLLRCAFALCCPRNDMTDNAVRRFLFSREDAFFVFFYSHVVKWLKNGCKFPVYFASSFT